MIVILIGYMGAGKTSLGKRLASRLNLKFVDTDSLIEQEQNISIQEIFDKYDEKHFRNLEKELIFKLKYEKNLLISTGGGMPCHNELIDELNKMGLTIYLKRPAKELASRILNSKKKRPLTEGKNLEELIEFIEKSISEREQFYNKAHIITERDAQNLSSLELMIKLKIKKLED